MKNFKIIAILLLVVFAVLEIFVFSEKPVDKVEKPVVSVSSFSLYDITKHIAKESVSVVNILPFGTDPHSFELTPKIMADIEKSKIIFYSGAGLEPWVDKITFKSKAIDMSRFVKLRKIGADESEHHEHHTKECAHNAEDPHYWLDFSNMEILTEVITKELSAIQPENSSFYEENKITYINMLHKLDKSYKEHLLECKINTVILNHNSLGYLAKRYGFHSESLSGLSPESEPSPSDIKRVLSEIKKDGVNTIFYENFINSKLLKAISKDSEVSADVIQPLGNITADEAEAKETYESLMYKNLEKLSKAMLCN
jgi:zinc transport system substrate-binding protein